MDYGPLCHSFWQNLKDGFRFLCPVSKTYCGSAGNPKDGWDDILAWKFTVGLGCNPGCVESAFWGATKFKYGKLDQSACGKKLAAI